MADRRLMECKHRGCFNLTRNKNGYCDEHQEEADTKEKARRKAFNDRYNQNNKFNKFYWSKAWKQLREYVLARDDFLCQDCLKRNKITEATDVHHIKKLRIAWHLRLDANNCIALCGECHKKRDRGE